MELDRYLPATGACAWGACAFSDLTLAPAARERALALCPGAAGVIVAAFPYLNGRPAGNLSLYARGEDYHQAILRRLEGAERALRRDFPGYTFLCGTDSSPLDERQCAVKAGVGMLGRHGLIMAEPYGSFLFLGTILTDYPLESPPQGAPLCEGCGACLRACPTGALGSVPFDASRCLSALTQKKGELTAEEAALLRAHPLIWGCDLCQLACPHNRRAADSPLDDLAGRREEAPYLPSLSEGDVDGLSNRTFRSAYGNRAFAWRGKAVLKRNLKLKGEQEKG